MRTELQPLDCILSEWAKAALDKAWPEVKIPEFSVVQTTSSEFGEYQCNAAMAVAKLLKKPPRDIARAILDGTPLHESIERAEIAGPGFINLYIKCGWLEKRLEAMAREERLCVPDIGFGQTVVMDYGSPNMSKPLHIGHLRSPNIGSALDKMHRFLGFKVISDNHLGDWGTQFGITIMGYRTFGDRKAMEQSPMEELERVYVQSYERGEHDVDWKNQCRQELVKLQAGDPENVKLWNEFMQLSLRELDRMYRRLGVKYDLVRGESHYNDKLKSVVDLLVSKGLARESEGALVVFLEEEKLPVTIVRKKDGGFNYMTTDLATIMSRVEEFNPTNILYLTDERQQLHFKQLFAIARKLGFTVKLQHAWFGLMRLPDAVISTRKGSVIKLEKLLDDAEERALAVVKEQSPDIDEERGKALARAVGLGAVKYADLSQNPQSEVVFTWDKALALNGNSAPYLQYAFARISSVRDKYRERFPGMDPEAYPIRLIDPIEKGLAVRVVRFPEAMIRAVENCRPNILCDYLYDLSQAYSSYYQNVPFLKAEEGVRESRVRLCGTVAQILRKG
ncbi:MAG: arginine--tRNA ligase, partial [bacterium]